MNKVNFLSKFFKLSSVFFVLSSMILGGCSNVRHNQTEFLQDQKNINHMMNSTVGLYDAERNLVYCTGFYVSEDIIATARHCVVDTDEIAELMEDETGELKTMLYEMPFHVVEYNTYLEMQDVPKYKTAHVLLTKVGFSLEKTFSDDVALLKLNKNEKKAPDFYKIVDKMPKIGENVYSVGFPMAMPWILSKGIVSQYFRLEERPLNILFNMTAFYGASGSPVVNEHGELVGLISSVGKAEYVVFCPSSEALKMHVYGFVE